MKSFKKLAVAAAVVSATAAGMANAAPTAPLFGSTTLLSDNSAEILINVDGSTASLGPGAPQTATVTTGDILITILGINSIAAGGPETQIGGSSPYAEITAITAHRITNSIDIDLPPLASPVDNAQGIDLGYFEFAALSAADAKYFDWSKGTIDLTGDGAVDLTFTTAFGATNNDLTFALVFEDEANNYSRTGSAQTGFTTSSDGAARLLLTLDGKNGDYLQVIGPINTGAFGTIPFATSVAQSSISLDATIATQNWPGLVFGPNITGGNGGLSSPTEGSGFPIFDNIDFTVNAQRVPEPGSLFLIAAGLLGLGYGRRVASKR